MDTRSEAQRSALVIIDMQDCYTRPAESFDSAGEGADLDVFYKRIDETVIPNIQRLLSAYRAAGRPIFYVEMGSMRPDGADLPIYGRRANETSRAATGHPLFPPIDDPITRTDDRIKPEPGEVVLRKTTTGTVASTPIDQNLRALGCDRVTVAGILTDCCVAQTSRELADLDFDVTVVEDACASLVPAHHQAILEIFENFYGAVAATDDRLAAVESA